MIKINRLPKEYQEVEYIETTGTQFIDTRVVINTNIMAETKVEVSTTAQDKSVLGFYVNSSSYYGANYYHLTCYNNKWYYGANGSEGNGGTYSPIIGTLYNIKFNDENNNIVINDEIIAQNKTFTGVDNSTLSISRRGTLTNHRFGIYKFYYFKIYDKTTQQYVRNFIPCYRKSDNVIGMFDVINNEFYTNSGTGTFLKGNNVQPKIKKIILNKNNSINKVKYIKTKVNNSMVKIYDELPTEYQRVEYIESSGAQHIDTGVLGETNTKVDITISVSQLVTDAFYFGNSDNGNRRFYIGSGWNNTGFAFSYGGIIKQLNQININQKYNFVFESGTTTADLYKDGVLWNTISSTPSGTAYSIYLFARNVVGYALSKTKNKLYMCKIYKENILVRNFVPCYRKADNVIGLYDLVNDVFYTNAGSGTFSKGSDI